MTRAEAALDTTVIGIQSGEIEHSASIAALGAVRPWPLTGAVLAPVDGGGSLPDVEFDLQEVITLHILHTKPTKWGTQRYYGFRILRTGSGLGRRRTETVVVWIGETSLQTQLTGYF